MDVIEVSANDAIAYRKCADRHDNFVNAVVKRDEIQFSGDEDDG